jgi:hypothetical protein
VDYVIDNHVGVFAPSPSEVAVAAARWLSEGAEGLKRRSQKARSLGHPDAVFKISEEIWDYAHHGMIATNRRKLWTDLAERTRELTDSFIKELY